MIPKLYVANDFLLAFARLPEAQQKKVREFTRKFQANPTLASINYEPIHDTRDPRVRTVRIDQTYRAVVLHPDKGADYVLVWVDHHDKAMAWARAKEFATNPATGALQLVDMEAVEHLSAPPVAPVKKPLEAYALFETIEDPDLLRLGVPLVLLPAVRKLLRAEELEALQPYLPQEAYEGLYYVSEGCSVDQALEYAAANHSPVSAAVDLGDALAHPDSRRRFHLLANAEDLDGVLDARSRSGASFCTRRRNAS
jgi:hypothetical protein